LGDVKTKAARRTISLSETAIAALRRQRKRQLEQRLAAGERWNNDLNLVFTTKEGRPLRAGNILAIDLKRITRKAGLEGVTLHTLRHTHASILIFQGVDIRTVSRRLGHENVTTTLQTYAHLLPGQDEAAAERVDSFISSLENGSC